MNEVSLGFEWPSASIRLARTIEAIQIINKLWEEGKRGNNDDDDDGFVDFSGQYFKIKNAKLYTPPSSGKIPFAVGEEATKIAARYTDGLITVTKPDKSKEIFDIFDKAASKEGKDLRSGKNSKTQNILF